MTQAWEGVLAFTLQIYFDFSGYTDMALGIALHVRHQPAAELQLPYRATSLADFWRRWHMTLSRFLRDYLYIPLGGNRHGLARQLLALLVTMASAGCGMARRSPSSPGGLCMGWAFAPASCGEGPGCTCRPFSAGG